MFWRRPLLWIAAGWIGGMAAASACSAGWIAAGAAVVCAAGFAAFGADRRRASAALLLAAAFVAGGLRFEFAEARNVSSVGLPDDAETEAVVEGTIASAPVVDGDRVVFDLSADRIAFGENAKKLPGERLKAYVRLESQEEQEAAAELRRGDEIVLNGELKRPLSATNFGGFDYRVYLERRQTYWTVHAAGLASAAVTPGTGRRWTVHRAAGVVDAVRGGLGERIDLIFSQPTAGFMKGLLLGIRDDLDPEQYRSFSQIGMTHILAISGLHVGIYIGTVLWLLGKLPITRERRLLLAMAAIPAYVVLTGASPSVLRAGIMAIIALYAARRGILKDGLHILAVAAMAMLAWYPYYLFDVSFQLSFAVTAGLIVLVPACSERLRFMRWAALRSAVSVTLVAQIVSFPLTIYYFNGFSLLSLAANFALVPVFSFAVLPIGSAALALTFVSQRVARLAALAAEGVTSVCYRTVEWLNGFESAFTIWATPPVWWIASFYAAVLTGAGAASGRLPLPAPRLRRAAAAVCAAAAAILCGYAYAPAALDRSAVVSFIDVGQGDAILVRTPAGKHLLIDGGGTLDFGKPGDEWRRRRDPFEVGLDVVVPLLKRRGVHAIDALFLTHADTDHIGGLQAVLEHIPVRRIYFNGTVKAGEKSEQLFRTAVGKGIPVVPASRGTAIAVDNATAIEPLYPWEADALREEDEQNTVSLVLLLTVYERTFLFTGDIEAAQEHAIVEAAGEQRRSIDVLKAAHHGSKTSTTEEWLRAWNPAAAVVSVGRANVYGHPHPTVVERLDAYGVRTLRTDLHGEVQFRVTPDRVQVRTRMER